MVLHSFMERAKEILELESDPSGKEGAEGVCL